MAHFKRLHRDEVARDLDLDPTDSPAQLHRKRRSFARLNHPDRAPEDWREAATTRMTIANQLIDEALKQAAARRPLPASVPLGPYGYITTGGSEERIEATLPPVLRPKMVPRS